MRAFLVFNTRATAIDFGRATYTSLILAYNEPLVVDERPMLAG